MIKFNEKWYISVQDASSIMGLREVTIRNYLTKGLFDGHTFNSFGMRLIELDYCNDFRQKMAERKIAEQERKNKQAD